MCFFLAFKGYLQRCAFCLLSFGLGFKVQGSRSGCAAFFYWGDARKWHLSHQSLVAPTIRGKESFHMRGVRSFGSVPTCSGWGFSKHRAFSSAQDDDTGRADGFLSGRYVPCFGTIGVIYDTSSPLEKGRAKGAGWIHEAV